MRIENQDNVCVVYNYAVCTSYFSQNTPEKHCCQVTIMLPQKIQKFFEVQQKPLAYDTKCDYNYQYIIIL